MTATSSWLALVPRDTVFVRDGRSFDAAANNSAETVMPGPATVAGAVGAAYKAEPQEVRGPVLARRLADGWGPYFPVPADLVAPSDEAEPQVFRMVPEDFGGQTDLGAPDGQHIVPQRWMAPPAQAEPAKEVTGWIPGSVLADYLAGQVPSGDWTPVSEFFGEKTPLVPEPRVGLARDDRAARTGFLYQSTHLRPREGWGFLAECTYESSWDRQAIGPVNFGGRGRVADPEPAACSWPRHPDGCVSQKVLVYLATPGLWSGGWHPPVPEGATLVAAVTGAPEPVTSLKPGARWRESRVLRWAVPAGSVYLLEFGSAERGAEWARKVHGTACDPGPDVDDRLRTAGFGVVLTGVWT